MPSVRDGQYYAPNSCIIQISGECCVPIFDGALPMEFSLAYRERFAGKEPSSSQANPVLYTRWVVADMTLLF